MEEVCQTLDHVGIHSDPIETFQRIRSFALPMSMIESWHSPERSDFKDVLWRTLLANQSERSVFSCPESYGDAFDQLILVNAEEYSTSLDIQSFINAVRKIVSYTANDPHPCLFTISNGIFGLGPPSCAKGGVICTVYGSYMPIALRPLGDYYQYIVDCCIHDLMDDQSVALYEPEDYSALFSIR